MNGVQQGSLISLVTGGGLGIAYLQMEKDVERHREILTRLSAVLCAIMAYRATQKLMPAAPIAMLAAFATLVYRRDVDL